VKHLRTVAAVVLAVSVAVTTPAPTEAQTEGVTALNLTTVATLDDPIAMAARTGTDDLYVAEREGVVRRL